jgi:hypothetical protein
MVTGRNFSMSGINSGRWNRTILNLCGIVVAILKMATGRNFSMSRIDSRHWNFSTGHHFQNGHHNTAQIQHCPISTTFHMLIDYDVPNWFLTSKYFYWSPFSKWSPQYRTNYVVEIGQCWICAVLWWPFWKWWPVKKFQCRESIRDIIIYPHIKFWWYRTMLNFYPPFLCRVLEAILKMADILKILKTQNCTSNGDLSLCQFNIVQFQRHFICG